MNENTALWGRLKQANLVKNNLPESSAKAHWPIRIMQGFAAWIASFFLLGFIATIFDWSFIENPPILLSLGLFCNAIAYLIFYKDNFNDFIYQIGFVANLCGQLLIAWAIWELNNNSNASNYFILFLYQGLLAFIIPQYLSRLLSTWFAMLMLFASFAELGVFNISITLASILFVAVWLKDEQWGKHSHLWSPIAYGLAFSLLQFNGLLILGEEIHNFFNSSSVSWINEISYWLRKIIIAAVFLYLTQHIRQKLNINHTSQLGLIIIGSSLGLILLDHFIPGLTGALLLLMIGLIKQQRLLISLGIAALLSFFSWYYYSLSITLLHKSILLMAFGFSFALAYFILSKSSLSEIIKTQQSNTFSSINKWITLGALLLILALVNFNIFQKENILENGQIILLKLAPVDPRSLMQGDYMRLRFGIENTLLESTEDIKNKSNSQYAVVALDNNNIATFSHLYDGNSLQEQKVKIQFRLRDNKIRLSTHAFFFEEGTADLYTPAKYGEFRVAQNGELLLNNLRDKDLKTLGYHKP